MPSYATTDQLIERFESNDDITNITDNDENNTPDTAVLTEALNNAEGEINGWLASRVLTPVDTSIDDALATFLRSMTLDIAVHLLFVRSQHESEATSLRYDARIEWLRAFAAGDVNLPGGAAPPASTSSKPVAVWGSSTPVFNRSTWGGV